LTQVLASSGWKIRKKKIRIKFEKLGGPLLLGTFCGKADAETLQRCNIGIERRFAGAAP
jgi:hypothetical protein